MSCRRSMLPVLGCLLIGCVTSVLAQTDGGNLPTLLGGDRPTLVGGAIDSTSELITAVAPNTVGAVANGLELGSEIARSLGEMAGNTGAASLMVLNAYEAQANLLKVLTADVLETQSEIQNAIRNDVTARALDTLFSPLDTIRARGETVQGILTKQAANAGDAVAGLVNLAGDAVAGVVPFVSTVANVAAAVRKAPAVVASGVFEGSAAATKNLQALLGEVTPLLPGAPAIQGSLSLYGRGLERAADTYTNLADLTAGWDGIQEPVVSAMDALYGAFAGRQLAAPELGAVAALLASGEGISGLGNGLGGNLGGLSERELGPGLVNLAELGSYLLSTGASSG